MYYQLTDTYNIVETLPRVVIACLFQINYDERNPFEVCGNSYTPIYKGEDMVSRRERERAGGGVGGGGGGIL